MSTAHLSTGRLLEQFHTGTLTRKTAGLDLLGSPKVMISVYDVEQLGIGNGDKSNSLPVAAKLKSTPL